MGGVILSKTNSVKYKAAIDDLKVKTNQWKNHLVTAKNALNDRNRCTI